MSSTSNDLPSLCRLFPADKEGGPLACPRDPGCPSFPHDLGQREDNPAPAATLLPSPCACEEEAAGQK
ncbi:hypothetical protein JTE90_002205 [Oedothorax gibbosus]|uniref:Uncharacterized protein n=1 Tax=Oedothorax gibbosus TaxID=931172 RepID=A0AAV6VFK5_9ARAC|nr:hypothetical protein JTE90_002205 [Oedothorax gibbosus]